MVELTGVASKKPYPLNPLLQQREQTVDVRAQQLQQKVEAARRAEEARQQALRKRQEQESLMHLQAQEEADRFDEGQAAVGDMMQLHAWRAVQEQRAKELADRVAAASERVRQADLQQGQARQKLATARADAKVIEKHRERYEAECRAAEERGLESEVEDVVNARWPRRKA